MKDEINIPGLSTDDLQRVSAVWNCERADLRSLIEAGHLDPKIDFRHADFRSWNFSRQDVRGIDFTGSDLRGSGFADVIRDSSTILTDAKLDRLDPTDGLTASIVGSWAMEKHERLRKYIDAYRAARAKFLPPRGDGGAAFIDLYSGAGRSLIEGTNDFVDGSPLVAFKAARLSRTGFSDLHFNDIDRESIEALRQRIERLGGAAHYYSEPADRAVERIVYALNPLGLHFAFLDPYNLENLPFSIIERLAKLPRMDMLIHVSIFDLQRNLRRYLDDGRTLDAFMPGWRDSVDVRRKDEAVRTDLLHYWLGLIRGLGTSPAEGIELVSATGGQRLYWLVFVSAHELGRKLWDDIRNIHVQGRLL